MFPLRLEQREAIGGLLLRCPFGALALAAESAECVGRPVVLRRQPVVAQKVQALERVPPPERRLLVASSCSTLSRIAGAIARPLVAFAIGGCRRHRAAA